MTAACRRMGKASALREPYHKPGPVCRRTTYNPSKPWMRHGTWNRERSVMPYARGPKVAPMGEHGLVVRRVR